MKFLLTILLLIFSKSLLSQPSVDKLDQEIRKSTKGKLTHLKKGLKDNVLSVYSYKSSNEIFSVMKRGKYGSGKKIDSLIAYQFSFINDTLLRVWYTQRDIANKKNGMIIAYISQNKIVAIKSSGNITMPSIQDMLTKSAELKDLAKELVNSK